MKTIVVNSNHVRSSNSLMMETLERVNKNKVYFLSASGIALFEFQPFKSSPKLAWDTAKLHVKCPIDTGKIDIPPPPPNMINPVKRFKVIDKVVYVSVNAFYGSPGGSGQAVNKFQLTSLYSDNAVIEAVVASYGTNSSLYRAAYKFEVLVYFDKWEEAIVPQ